MIQTLRPLTRRDAWLAIGQLLALVVGSYGLVALAVAVRWWLS